MKTKTVVVVILLIVTTNVFSQLSIDIGIDPKIAVLGTDNKYTLHDGVFNFKLKIEGIDRDNRYFAFGWEYANLSQYFISINANYGHKYELLFKKLIFIPQLEIGQIIRDRVPVNELDKRTDDKLWYAGVNLPIRWKINNTFSLEAEGNIDLAVDLPNRKFRYGGTINLIIVFYNLK